MIKEATPPTSYNIFACSVVSKAPMSPEKSQIPSEGINYFVPQSLQPLGTVTPGEHTPPKLFTPLTIKNLSIPHRIGVSPMVTYSSAPTGPEMGVPNDFHFQHYASLAMHGAGFIIVESSSITPEARGSPNDAGIWSDEQAVQWKRVVDFIHSQKGVVGMQLGHTGRKTSTKALSMPGNPLVPLGADDDGWHDQRDKVLSASEVSFSEEHGYAVPTEMTKEQIKEYVGHYKAAKKRAVEISGFDFVEIHAAHGYLINSFLSKTCNKRTDEYGGSLENRARFLLEIVDAVKDDDHPLFVRVSGDELTPDDPDSWRSEDTVELAKLLADHGVDVIDVSSGGININAQRRPQTPGANVPLAQAVKRELGDRILVASVGSLHTPEVAQMTVANGYADIVLIGRLFLKNPGLVWQWADKLGVKLQVGRSYGWAYGIH